MSAHASTLARVLPRDASVMHHAAFARAALSCRGVTELVVNRPGEYWVETDDRWQRHDAPELDLAHLLSLARAVASYCGDHVADSRPILSAVLPGGERLQAVRPPACEAGTVSLSIRRPAEERFTLDALDAGGLFDHVEPAGRRETLRAHERELAALLAAGDHRAFLRLAVQTAQTIVVAGRTSSGKTTLMKTLADLIDPAERLVTIEDTPELALPNHPNRVHLFYSSEDRDKPDAAVTPITLLRSCYRMRPDRILVAEVRGTEAAEFLAAASSGHAGSITSVHAGSCALALDRIAEMVLKTTAGSATGYETISQQLRDVIDVVIHMDNDTAGGRGRHITEIRYLPAERCPS